MFESRSKKEPKLVFSHKSSPHSMAIKSGADMAMIPRVSLSAGNGVTKNGDTMRTDGTGSVSGRSTTSQLTAGKEQSKQVSQEQELQPIQRQYDIFFNKETRKTVNDNVKDSQDSDEKQTQQFKQNQGLETQFLTLQVKEDANKVTSKNVFSAESTPSTGQPNGQPNILYKDVGYAERASPKNEAEGAKAVINAKIEQFEGYSIYRGPRESAMAQTTDGLNGKFASVGGTRAPEVYSSYVTSSSQKSEDEPAVLRYHGASARAAIQSYPQPYQTLQRQHQQYQRNHQMLQSQQQNMIADHHRQVQDLRNASTAYTRVVSYPQPSRQMSAKTVRLVGSAPGESGKVLMVAGHGKQRSHSYSAAPRYVVPVTVQAPYGYTTVVIDGHVSRQRHNSVTSRLSGKDDQDPVSPFPSTPINTQRPKSILKTQPQPEVAPEWHQNARTIHIPRAQSLKNSPVSPSQNYDFSTILTVNSDIVSFSKNKNPGEEDSPNGASDATSQKSETSQLGMSQKKSVKFNNQVRLHLDDHVSNVVALAAPT